MRRALALALVLGACAPVAGAPSANGIVLDAEGLSPAGSVLRVDFGRQREGAVVAVSHLVGAGPASASACGEGVEEVRWEHIQRVYELCDRNVSETARRLSMHRRTLQRILAKRSPR